MLLFTVPYVTVHCASASANRQSVWYFKMITTFLENKRHKSEANDVLRTCATRCHSTDVEWVSHAPIHALSNRMSLLKPNNPPIQWSQLKLTPVESANLQCNQQERDEFSTELCGMASIGSKTQWSCTDRHGKRCQTAWLTPAWRRTKVIWQKKIDVYIGNQISSLSLKSVKSAFFISSVHRFRFFSNHIKTMCNWSNTDGAVTPHSYRRLPLSFY